MGISRFIRAKYLSQFKAYICKWWKQPHNTVSIKLDVFSRSGVEWGGHSAEGLRKINDARPSVIKGKNISICNIFVAFGRLIDNMPYKAFSRYKWGDPGGRACNDTELKLFCTQNNLYPTFWRELRDCAKNSAKKYGPNARCMETLRCRVINAMSSSRPFAIGQGLHHNTYPAPMRSDERAVQNRYHY